MTAPGDSRESEPPDDTHRAREVLAGYALGGSAPSAEDLDAGIAREVGRLDARSKEAEPDDGDE